VNDTELFITRAFDAPASLVFSIWEKADHFVRWLGPKEFRCTGAELDFRPGGAWSASMFAESYGERRMGGRYVEIERDRRIVFTFTWRDEHEFAGVETLVTVTFRERDGQTIQDFHQQRFKDVDARDSHIVGWSECFDREQAYVERLAEESRA
jgi:uncharacterized protein YndB with AHSA1/START domain